MKNRFLNNYFSNQNVSPEFDFQETFNIQQKRPTDLNLNMITHTNKTSPIVSPKFGGTGSIHLRKYSHPISTKNSSKAIHAFNENVPIPDKEFKEILNENSVLSIKDTNVTKKRRAQSNENKSNKNCSRKMFREANKHSMQNSSQRQSKKNSHSSSREGSIKEFHNTYQPCHIEDIEINLSEGINNDENNYHGNINTENPDMIYVELKKIKHEPLNHNQWRRVNSLFDKVISADKLFGKALIEIKHLYDKKISQLNERVGIHDMKSKEYKNEAIRQKKICEEKDQNYKVLKLEIHKQELHLEKQKEIIKYLKKRLDTKKESKTITIEKNASMKLDVEKSPLDNVKLKTELSQRQEKKTNMSMENSKIWKRHKNKPNPNLTVGEIHKTRKHSPLGEII